LHQMFIQSGGLQSREPSGKMLDLRHDATD
jgi:hypothetical protein